MEWSNHKETKNYFCLDKFYHVTLRGLETWRNKRGGKFRDI